LDWAVAVAAAVISALGFGLWASLRVASSVLFAFITLNVQPTKHKTRTTNKQQTKRKVGSQTTKGT
jgi:hypothetical protein